jgi:hypothetical protein
VGKLMKLKQLKQEAIELWEILNEVDGTASLWISFDKTFDSTEN